MHRGDLPAVHRYLGGWPARQALAPEGAPAILDCTCELPRMLHDLPYHNLPMWDTHGKPLTPCAWMSIGLGRVSV